MARLLDVAGCVLLVAAAGAARGDDGITPADPQLGRPADFLRDVAPILEAKCLACHSRSMHEGDLVLERVEAILQGGGSGPAVVPGQADASLLYKVCSRNEEPFMPPQPNTVQAAPLTPLELGVLRKWIEEGARPGEPRRMAAVNWRAAPEQLKAVYSLAVSPEGRFIAAGRGNRIDLYDFASRRLLGQLNDPALRDVVDSQGAPLHPQGAAQLDFVHALAFSPDGEWLASAGYREVKLWRRERSEPRLRLSMGAAVKGAAVSADGALSAVILADHSVRLWRLTTGQPGPTIPPAAAPVSAVAVSPDATLVATAGEDGMVRFWKSADGAPTFEFAVPSPAASLVFLHDGQRVACGHADGMLRLWAVPAESPAAPVAPVQEIGGHNGPIVAMRLRAGANELATACADGHFRRVNLDNGAVESAVQAGAPATSAALSPDGAQQAAAAPTANLARLWKRDGQQIAELRGDPTLDRTSRRRTEDAAIADAQAKLAEEAVKQAEKDAAERDETLKKANETRQKAGEALVEPEKKRDELKQKQQAAAEALAQKPDDDGLKQALKLADEELAKGEAEVQKARDAIASADRGVQLSQQSLDAARQNVDARKAQQSQADESKRQADGQSQTAAQAAQAAPGPVRGVAFSPDGLLLATACDDGKIHLWSAISGAWRESLNGAAGPLSLIEFTPTGELLALADSGELLLWDVAPRWTLDAVLTGVPADASLDAEPVFVDRVLCLAFSPDGTRLATGGGDPSRSGELMIWDVASRSVLHRLADAHSDTVFDVEFSRDGRRLASCGADKFVRVFDSETGALVRSYEGHTGHVLGLAWKQDGSSLASCGADNAIKVWNVETGEQRRTISNYSKQVNALSYIGISDSLVSCGGDAAVKFHNAGNGGNYRSFAGMPGYVYAAAAAPDEAWVLAAGEDGSLRLWNGKNGQLEATLEPPVSTP